MRAAWYSVGWWCLAMRNLSAESCVRALARGRGMRVRTIPRSVTPAHLSSRCVRASTRARVHAASAEACPTSRLSGPNGALLIDFSCEGGPDLANQRSVTPTHLQLPRHSSEGPGEGVLERFNGHADARKQSSLLRLMRAWRLCGSGPPHAPAVSGPSHTPAVSGPSHTPARIRPVSRSSGIRPASRHRPDSFQRISISATAPAWLCPRSSVLVV